MVKRLLLLFSLLLALLGLVQAQTDEAAQAYQAGDYSSAIIRYEAMVKVGQTNGEVFFNLGNIYATVNEAAYALLNYRRAALYLARDRDLQASIAAIQAEKQLPSTNVDWLLTAANGLSQVIAVRELSYLGLGLWSVFFLCVALAILQNWSKRWRTIVSLFSIIVLLALGLLGLQLYVHYLRPSAIVIRPIAQVMSGPGEDYLPLYSLPSSNELYIIERSQNWVRFALADGRQGWLSEADFEYVSLEIQKYMLEEETVESVSATATP